MSKIRSTQPLTPPKTPPSRSVTLAAAVALAATILVNADPVQAQGLGGMVNTLTANLDTIRGLLAVVAYIAGIAIGIAGIFKLKQHVDNPTQVKLQDGLIRLAAGGGLVALPFLINAVIDTVGGDTNTNLNAPQF